jgi:hypothetical protein
VSTFHAVPVALGHFLHPEAVRVVRCIAAIAKEEDVLPLGGVADGTWAALLLLLFNIFNKPLLKVKVGDLFLVVDVVCR